MTELPVPAHSRAMIGRWNVDQYLDLLTKPLIVFSALTLVAALLQQSSGVIVAIEAFAIGWTTRKIWQHNGRRVESLTGGVVLGLGMGLGSSLGTFIVHPTLIDAIRGVSTTLLTGLIVGLMTVSLNILLSFRKHS